MEQLFEELNRRGIKLKLLEDDLSIVAPKGALDDELRQGLRLHKTQILAMLRAAQGGASMPQVIAADPAGRFEPFALTDLQHAYWVGRDSAVDMGNVATQLYVELDCAGLELERLNDALCALVERHDMLRAVVNGDGMQAVLPSVPRYRIATDDQSNAAPEQIAQVIELTRNALMHQVRKADQWPLFAIRATLLPEARLRLHVSLDMLVLDAWSVACFFREWHQLYEGTAGAAAQAGLSFRDCVLAERRMQDTAPYRKAQAYWTARVEQLPEAPDLPLRQDPAARKAPRFSRRLAVLDKTRWEGLKTQARARGITPPNLLLALYAEVLARWSATPHFTINATISNRLPEYGDLTGLMGNFTSVMLHEVDLRQRTPAFADLARGVQSRFLQDMEHRQLSGVAVMREWAKRRGMSLAAAMPVVFSCGLIGNGEDEAGKLDYFGEKNYSVSQTSQVWLHLFVVEANGDLQVNWDAVEAVFEAGVLDAMFTSYRDALERLSGDVSLWDKDSLAALPAEMQHRRNLADLTAASIPERSLYAGLMAYAQKNPAAPAVIAPQRTLSYGDLLNESMAVADWLCRHGVRAGQPVAVSMRKGWEQIVAVYGVLLAGAAYMPVDADLPPRRQRELMRIGEIAQILTQPDTLRDELNTDEWHIHLIEAPAQTQVPAQYSPMPEPAPDQLAYVIFTSGTTGLPKGVMIDHRGAMNTIEHVNRMLAAGPGDRVLAVSSLSFDLSVYDIFGLHDAGGALVLPDWRRGHDAQHWRELIVQHRVTLWNSAPQLMQMLMDSFQESESDHAVLRRVMLSGDFIPLDLPGRIRQQYAQAEVISLGGATEASIWSNYFPVREVDPAWSSIPYGRALPNQSIGVYDQALRPCPDHVKGRIYIGGIGLAKGYWRDAEKTAARFITHPRSGERLYDTGDLGRYAADGNVLILGRDDGQVKIRGHRIELGEIDAVLSQHPGVRQAVVLALADQAQRRQLAAYVEAREQGLTAQALKDYLSERLPDYMVPPHVLVLDALPVSPNGKIDYRALPAIGADMEPAAQDVLQPRNAVERTMLALWSQVIGSGEIGIADNFFELGGDSLLATQLVRALNAGLPDFKLQMHELFENLTIESLAALYLQRQEILQQPADAAASSDSAAMLADIQTAIDSFAALDFSGAAAEHVRTIFLTGASGWIGSHLLAELLSSTNARLYCLVRTQDGLPQLMAAMQRNGIAIEPQWPGRIELVRGDLSRPDLGLTPHDWQSLSASVDAIYHLGASLNVLVDYARLREVNVAATGAIVRLAADHHLKPVFFASPMAVSRRYLDGRQTVLREEGSHPDPEGLLTGYAKSKWAAERILLAAAERGLPVKIYRSSHALPSSRNGAAKPNDTFATVLQTACAAGVLPEDSGAVFHGVPVDLLARLIVENALLADGYRGVVHIENRDPLKLDALIALLLATGAERRGPTHRVGMEEWKHACRQAASNLPDAAAGLAQALFAERTGGAGVDHMFSPEPIDTGYFERSGQAGKLAHLTPAVYWEKVRRAAGW